MADAILMHNLINVVSSGEMKLVKKVDTTTGTYSSDYEIPNANTWTVGYLNIVKATIAMEHLLMYDPSWYTLTSKGSKKLIATGQVFDSASSASLIRIYVGVWNGTPTHRILICEDASSAANMYFYK